MGKWSMQFFERECLPETCFLIPGTTKKSNIDHLLSFFDTIEYHQHTHFERYIVTKSEKNYLLILQAYGAATIIDLLSVLKDGNVKNIIFIGSAFGFIQTMNIGDIIIPNIVQALDGIIPFIEGVKYSYPDKNQTEKIKERLVSGAFKFIDGKTVSVPCVTVQPESKLIDKDVLGLEMECASFYFYSQKLKIKASAILIVSDTIHKNLVDNNGDYKMKIAKIIDLII